MILLFGLPDAFAFSEYDLSLYWLLMKNNLDFLGFSGYFNELRCMTLMWLCDPARTSWKITENKRAWAFLLPPMSQRVEMVHEFNLESTNSHDFGKYCERFRCFSIHFINSSFSNHWELGKLGDFPLISCLCSLLRHSMFLLPTYNTLLNLNSTRSSNFTASRGTLRLTEWDMYFLCCYKSIDVWLPLMTK